MTRRAFDVRDIVEILMHWHAGRPKAVIAEASGWTGAPSRKYVAKAAGGRPAPRRPRPCPGDQWAMLVHSWFPELVDPRAPEPHPRRHRGPPGPHRGDARDQHRHHGAPAPARRARPRRRADQLPPLLLAGVPRGPGPRRSPPRPGRRSTPARRPRSTTGSWARGSIPSLERVRRVWAFVMVLACSRHMFVRPVLKMDQRAWTAAHVAAFSFFGGAPRRLVPENVPRNIFRLLLPGSLCGRACSGSDAMLVSGLVPALRAT